MKSIEIELSSYLLDSFWDRVERGVSLYFSHELRTVNFDRSLMWIKVRHQILGYLNEYMYITKE